jgi:hypothetical protein
MVLISTMRRMVAGAQIALSIVSYPRIARIVQCNAE